MVRAGLDLFELTVNDVKRIMHPYTSEAEAQRVLITARNRLKPPTAKEVALAREEFQFIIEHK